MLLVGNGKLFTRDPAMPYLEDGAVVIDGEAIREVGTQAALRAKYPNAEYVDARGGPTPTSIRVWPAALPSRATIPPIFWRCWTEPGGTLTAI